LSYRLGYSANMKRIPEDNSRNTIESQLQTSFLSEMDGLVELGMKDESLRRARHALKQKVIKAKGFNEALNALLTHADRVKAWAKLVESAYERLPKRQRPAIRFLMMSFRNSCHNPDGVLQLMSRTFTGEFALMELAYAMEAAFELDKKELVQKLARRLPRAIREAEHPIMHSLLLLCSAELRARAGKWDETIAILQTVQSNETLSQNAVTGIVEAHAVRALLALRDGFQLIERFNRNFDPKIETMLPGNDKAVLEQAAKEFKRLQRILERIVPEKRRMQLGIA
jgi:hypothetical protein